MTATAYPDRTFEARLLSIGAMVDPTTRTVPILAETPNPDDMLKLGMFVRIVARQRDHRGAPDRPHRGRRRDREPEGRLPPRRERERRPYLHLPPGQARPRGGRPPGRRHRPEQGRARRLQRRVLPQERADPPERDRGRLRAHESRHRHAERHHRIVAAKPLPRDRGHAPGRGAGRLLGACTCRSTRCPT